MSTSTKHSTTGAASASSVITDYLAALGRLGGQAKTDRKAESSRLNGKKGGRPKKNQQLTQLPKNRIHK